MKFWIGVAVAIFCLLLTRVSAQTLAITSEVAVWPTAPVEWAGVDAVAIANSPKPVLLSGGDWLLATSSSTRLTNTSPQVDQVTFERRSSRGLLQWRIQRTFTNTPFVQVGPQRNIVVTRSGLFHVFVGGSVVNLWTGTLEGTLVREESSFARGGEMSIYADDDRLVLSHAPWSQIAACFDTLSLDGTQVLSSFCRDGSLGFGGTPWLVGHADASGYWLINQGTVLMKIGPEGRSILLRPFRIGSAGGAIDLRLFKWLGDKVLVGGWAQASPGNDLSQSFGLQDAWLVWTDLQGNRIRDGVYGGVGRKTLEGWVQTEDGGFVLAIDSRGSGVSGNKTIDGNGVWLVKISSTGAIQGQRLIPNQLFLAMGSSETGISLLVRDAATGTRVQSIQIATEVIAKIRALAPEPFDLLTSTNLQTWRVLGTQVLGEVVFSQPARQGTQFYRMVPAQR